jgi:exocyst complex component 4
MIDPSEYLKTVPDMLETLMSEKRLLPASALLMSSLKIICNESMRDIGALADLKSYLSGQETVRANQRFKLSHFTS